MYSGFQAGQSSAGLGAPGAQAGQTNAGLNSRATYKPRDPNYNINGGNDAQAKAQVLKQQALNKTQTQMARRASEQSPGNPGKLKRKTEKITKAKPNPKKAPR